MGSAVSEYFKQKGAIRIFCVIDSDGKRHSEIADAVHLSPGTLSSRLSEALGLGLLRRPTVQHDDEQVDKYKLTLKGNQIRKAIIRLQLNVIYAELYRSEELFQGHSDLFREWIEDEFEQGNYTELPSLDEYLPEAPDIETAEDIASSDMEDDET